MYGKQFVFPAQFLYIPFDCSSVTLHSLLILVVFCVNSICLQTKSSIYLQMDEDSFRESFKNALFYLFTFGDTSANVDRVVQFVATFCTTLDDEEEFLLFIFDIIFNVSYFARIKFIQDQVCLRNIHPNIKTSSVCNLED